MVLNPADVHPIQRAQERYGVTLSLDDLANLEAQIVCGESVLMQRERFGKEKHMVSFGETVMAAVFSPLAGRILTFLDPTHLTNKSQKIHHGFRLRTPIHRRFSDAEDRRLRPKHTRRPHHYLEEEL